MKKDSNNGQGSSSVFKIGSISLAFLIIGYQSALFIHKTAVLHIEANRDHPDTVYIQLPPQSISEPSGKKEEPLPRKYAVHSEVVTQVRSRDRRKAESFPFDPNTVSLDDLQRLGFSLKQATAIDNYRKKGGRFRRPADFGRSYVVSDSVFNRLLPYIMIPKVNINTADSAALDALPGIGPYLVAKILEFRRDNGPFQSPEQLMDIQYFDRERYEAIKDLVTCGGDDAEARQPAR